MVATIIALAHFSNKFQEFFLLPIIYEEPFIVHCMGVRVQTTNHRQLSFNCENISLLCLPLQSLSLHFSLLWVKTALFDSSHCSSSCWVLQMVALYSQNLEWLQPQKSWSALMIGNILNRWSTMLINIICTLYSPLCSNYCTWLWLPWVHACHNLIRSNRMHSKAFHSTSLHVTIINTNQRNNQ